MSPLKNIAWAAIGGGECSKDAMTALVECPLDGPVEPDTIRTAPGTRYVPRRDESRSYSCVLDIQDPFVFHGSLCEHLWFSPWPCYFRTGEPPYEPSASPFDTVRAPGRDRQLRDPKPGLYRRSPWTPSKPVARYQAQEGRGRQARVLEGCSRSVGGSIRLTKRPPPLANCRRSVYVSRKEQRRRQSGDTGPRTSQRCTGSVKEERRRTTDDQGSNPARSPRHRFFGGSLNPLLPLGASDTRCVHITDIGVGYISTMLSLSALFLRWCTQIRDFGLQHLCSMRNLQVLSLAGCPLLTSSGLSSLIQLRHLQELELTNCPGASQELFDYLREHLPRCLLIE
ncbi:conserved hypothetical protein [Culex quinquefasciatus]|uniref:Uncharacterized protein n=1 Tax=Culex quinquefasciatus TaxID=7176 RepID=B0WLD6_CULQU|nr:conserved hypothetical protein [Culex quinquefasciatus]|eukprot:XP_001849520.1 conserved hypothetical protein [Culex quinquefasciatus]